MQEKKICNKLSILIALSHILYYVIFSPFYLSEGIKFNVFMEYNILCEDSLLSRTQCNETIYFTIYLM